MIAQPIVSTPTKQPQAGQAQPPASANGFLSLLSPDASLLNMPQPGVGVGPGAPQPANTNKSGNTNNNANATPTPYVQAPPVQSTIVPTAAANQPAPSPTSIDQNAALQAGANQLSLNGSAIPSNPVLPASNPQRPDAGQSASPASTANGQADPNAAGSAAGNSTDFGANVNARIAAGAPIYASQPNASMATVPPHLLNAAAPDAQAGASTKAGDDATQKTSSEAGTEPVVPASNMTTAAPTLPLHPNHDSADQNQDGANGNQNNTATTTAANADSSGASSTDANAASNALAAQSSTQVSTPVQVDAAVHTAAPYVPVGEQVALNVKQAIAADNNEIHIQLKPASLGTIDVKLNLTQDGRISAVISADRSDTLKMLKQDSGTLQQSLRDAGLNADSSSLSFNLRGDAQSFAQNSAQGGIGRGGNSGGSAYTNGIGDALGGTDSTASSQSYHTGSLDIEV